MLDGGVDAVLVETAQDLLQAKAAIIGARRAIAGAPAPRPSPLIVHVTVETTGTMLLGTEIGAALTALEPLGIDLIGLNCATGPAEMSEHLRYLSRHAGRAARVHAQRRPAAADRRRRPLPADPGRAGRRARHVHREYGLAAGRRLLRHDAGAPAPGRRAGRAAASSPRASHVASRARRRSTSTCRSGRTRRTCRSASGRTPTARKAFREAMLAETLGRLRRDRARADPRRRAPARPLRRLRRPRRRRRHDASSPAGWPPRRRCRSCSTRPSPR